MNSRILVIVITFIVVLGAFLYQGNKKKEDKVQGLQTQATNADQIKDDTAFESQSKTMGAVKVEATPVKLKRGQNMVFKLVFNTHSVDLSYDYIKIITAQDDGDKIYKALRWSSGNSGHHLSGEAELESLSENARGVKLNINKINGQSTVFEWQL